MKKGILIALGAILLVYAIYMIAQKRAVKAIDAAKPTTSPTKVPVTSVPMGQSGGTKTIPVSTEGISTGSGVGFASATAQQQQQQQQLAL